MEKCKPSVSDKWTIDISVPQGSLLGRILFIMYLNDINYNYIQHSEIVNLFADDSLVASSESEFDSKMLKMRFILENLKH